MCGSVGYLMQLSVNKRLIILLTSSASRRNVLQYQKKEKVIQKVLYPPSETQFPLNIYILQIT